MSENDSGYVVVFEYTERAGGYRGVRTFSVFKDKADFDSQKLSFPGLVSGQEKVLEEGVSEERRVELIEDTPLKAYVGAAFEAARMPSGEIHPDILEMHLTNTAVLAAKRSR